MKRKKLEDMIESVMEHFNWDRTEKTMRYLNWTWAGVPGEGVPNIDDLKSNARYLIGNAIKGALEDKTLRPWESYFSATGGMKASVTKNKYNQINYINLEFILTSWNDDGD
jgi:hypothetical protein